jgi:phytoene desaturase
VPEGPDVVVVGGGVGGMAAALRLGVAGFDVLLLDRRDHLGGKLDERTLPGGYRVDTGPSLLTLPDELDQLFRLIGSSLDEAVGPVRLDPICSYRWPDGSRFEHRAGRAEAVAEAERLSTGSGAAFGRFLDRSRTVWEVAERTFLAGPMGPPGQLVRRLRSPGDLLAIDPLRTLAARARRTFADPRLVQWACRYATYSGSTAAAPATLACIAHIEQAFGAWWVPGGLAALAPALGRALAAAGVEVRTGADVESVLADDGAVRGVRLASGEEIPAGVVVANVDADHLYADLLGDPRALRRARRAPPSSSGFALLLGLAGRTEGLGHHTVLFSDPAEYEAELAGRAVPRDPTVYVANASATDPTVAPDGHESWFVLVNVPAGARADWDAYRDHVLDVLAARGLDLSGRLRAVEVVTPEEIGGRYRARGGAIYGTSSSGRRAAFLRPGNRGARRGLYLVGGSSHPGGGLPLVARSGAIVARMVAQDAGRRSVGP